MKKIMKSKGMHCIFTTVMIVMCLLLIAVTTEGTDRIWMHDIVDNTVVPTTHTSMAVDSQGHPHIAYYDATYPDNCRVRYAHYDGRAWHSEYATGAIGNCSDSGLLKDGPKISLVLDSNDYPHIAYIGVRRHSTSLSHAYFNGSDWDEEVIDTRDNRYGLGYGGYEPAFAITQRSLGIDRRPGNDNVSICYTDLIDTDLKYAYFNVPDWEYRTLDILFGATFTFPTWCTMFVDYSNHPQILYGSNYTGLFPLHGSQLKLSYFNDDNGQQEAIDIVRLPNDNETLQTGSIAVDSIGKTHMAWGYSTDGGFHYGTIIPSPDAILVKKQINNTDFIRESSLALDSNDHPHIVYNRGGFDLVYSYSYDGAAWQDELVIEREGGGVSLAIDSRDNSHISHVDYKDDLYNEYDNILKYSFRCTDTDDDGICEGYGDNCPDEFNPEQTDTDNDGIGNSCDTCRWVASSNNADSDGDGRGDVCDNCRYVANAGPPPTYKQYDADGDGVGDECDNCVDTPNGPDKGTCVFGPNAGASCDRSINSECKVECYDNKSICENEGISSKACYTQFIQCLDDCDCGSGVCTLGQEDCNRNGLGDACDSGECIPNPPSGLRVDDYIDPIETLSYNQNISAQCNSEICSGGLVYLIWGGSTMELSLYTPAGDHFKSVSSSSPPITIEVPKKDLGIGEWEIKVTAVDVPGPDYPFTLSVKGKTIYCPNDPQTDADNDGRCGDVDNCPDIYNPDQIDRDGDGIGDLCDIPDTIQVSIDILPEDCPDSLNTNTRGSKKGVLPVVILGLADFDVQQIDPLSVRLEGVEQERWSLEDITQPHADCTDYYENPDGHPDLALKFSLKRIQLAIGEVANGQEITLHLTGNLKKEFGGTSIAGEAIVIIERRNN